MNAFLFLSLVSVSSSGLCLIFMVLRSSATTINRSNSNRSSYRDLSSVQLRVLILPLHQRFKGHKFVSSWISKTIFF